MTRGGSILVDMTTPCPGCHAEIEPLPIIYGYPTPETFLEYEAGRLALGGCMIDPESPAFECPACGASLPVASGPRPRRRRRTVAQVDTEPAS